MTPDTAPSTALTSESIISWWKDWQSFLRLSLEANALRARTVSADVFDLDQDDGARREGDISERLSAIPSTRRTIFTGELEAQRGRQRALHERTQGAAELDLHAIERLAIEALLEIAEGDRQVGRAAAVPTEHGVWYDVDPAVVEQVPDAETYAIRKGRHGPGRTIMILSVIAAIWAGIGALYYVTRPEIAVSMVAAPAALVNGGPLQPWPLRALRLAGRDLPIEPIAADAWPDVQAGRAGWKAGTLLPMELCVPRVEAAALPATLTLLGAGSNMDRVVSLAQQAPSSPMLRLTTCGGGETLAYGTLAATTPQPAIALGESWRVSELGEVSVSDVRAIGPGQDTSIPPGRVQVQVSLTAPDGVDWPRYRPSLTLADGTSVRSSAIRPAASGDSLAAIYDVAAEHLQGPTPLLWELHDPSPAGATYRWRASISPPRARLAELTASTRFAVSAASWQGQRLSLTLQITNTSALPLAISASDLSLSQDGFPLSLPPFSVGSALLIPGKGHTLTLELSASPAQPVTLYLGASGVVITPPAGAPSARGGDA